MARLFPSLIPFLHVLYYNTPQKSLGVVFWKETLHHLYYNTIGASGREILQYSEVSEIWALGKVDFLSSSFIRIIFFFWAFQMEELQVEFSPMAW